MNRSAVINLVGQCAVIAAVIAVGLLTVGPVGTIALVAGASVAIFYGDARATRLLCRRPPPASRLEETVPDEPPTAPPATRSPDKVQRPGPR